MVLFKIVVSKNPNITLYKREILHVITHPMIYRSKSFEKKTKNSTHTLESQLITQNCGGRTFLHSTCCNDDCSLSFSIASPVKIPMEGFKISAIFIFCILSINFTSGAKGECVG